MQGPSESLERLEDELSRDGLIGNQSQQVPVLDDDPVDPYPQRFVGDLNPQARLLDQGLTPGASEDVASGEVGVWVQHEGPSPSTAESPASTRTGVMVSDILSYTTCKALSDLYFANMHPLLPILNEEEFRQGLTRGTASVPLVHVVCLLAAKIHGAERCLRILQPEDKVVSVREFCSQLHASISVALSRRVRMGKVTRMRVLSLLSLHQEGPEGMEESSSCIVQAAHDAQSLALHLPRPNDPNSEYKRLFWCLWTLDRLNAATNSRPCIINDIDVGVAELLPEESGFLAFDVWLKIATMLNKVIGLYRPPTGDTVSGWDLDFPGFEQILDEVGAWRLPSSTIGS